VAALEVWDDSPVPWWSQLPRRLRDDPGVWSLLERALGEHPATSGRLNGLWPLRPARPSFSAWLTGTWHPDGTQVLVKVNVTQRERFWMSAASRGAPGSVPHVFASDDALGPVDAGWLILERLPYTHDPGWGAVAFSSLLAAAARFQVFAATVDTDLVVDEDVESIRRFARGGQDLCPEAATLVSHLDRDWAWVEAMAPREVLFGDLHFGNAAFRSPPPDLVALLYDPIPGGSRGRSSRPTLRWCATAQGWSARWPRSAARKAGRPASRLRSTGCRHCSAGGSHSRSGAWSRTGMLISPSGRG
jgi:hypothetical protein